MEGGRHEDEYATWRVEDMKMNLLDGKWQIYRITLVSDSTAH